MRHWSDEARKAQAEAIRRWKPWTKSTGPRTAAGKSVCARNARCRDGSVMLVNLIKSALRRQRLYLRAHKMCEKQTIMTGLKAFDFKAEDEAFLKEINEALRLLSQKFRRRPENQALPPCDMLRVA